MSIRAFPFFDHVRLSHSVGPGLMLALFVSPMFLIIPSFLSTALVGLGLPFLIAFFSHFSCLGSSMVSTTNHSFLGVHGFDIRLKI